MRHRLRYKAGRKLISQRMYEDDLYVYGHSVYVDTYIFGVRIYTKIVFHEIIPEWAVIKMQTLGYSGWESERPLLVKAAIENRIIRKP